MMGKPCDRECAAANKCAGYHQCPTCRDWFCAYSEDEKYCSEKCRKENVDEEEAEDEE